LLLPVIPGLNAGSSQPACNSLRGEPCRSYESFDNTASPSQPTSADVADESGGGGGSPTMSLRVRPRRPHDDRTYNFKLIVTSSDSNCLGGVTVRLGGETARTDSRGIAHISHRYGKPGTRTAKAGKAGCGKARFEITVRP
jgi:hypothetical protein